MKIISYLKLGAGCFILLLGGCISLPNSPISPTPRFYMLSAIIGPNVSKTINIAPGIIIGVGPVKLPDYLNRPQMVTKDKAGTLKFDEFDRWGESLDLGIARLVREDLTVMLPGTKLVLYPWDLGVAVKYQVTLEIVGLDSEIDQDMRLVVQWTIIDTQNPKMVIIKRSAFRTAINPPNYSGLAKILSAQCAALSGQIAQALSSIK